MAVVNNTATENGDIIQVRSTIPVIGLISLTSFLDDTDNETVNDYFEKTFRYSRNGGLTWSNWESLTSLNIQGVSVEKQDAFVIEYYYKRVGTGATPIVFNEITLSGSYEELNYPYYSKSVFSKFFGVNDAEVLQWALTVLEKIYEKGILASYIDRGYVTEGGGTSVDDDFITFWYTKTHAFAILVHYARQFEDLANNEILLQELANNLGIYTTLSPDIQELSYIYNNYIDEFERRGTERIYEKQSSDDNIDGELLRLLNYVSSDEFIFALVGREEIGWNIGNSSPLYRGTDRIVNLNKAYEDTIEVVDLNTYPLIDSSSISINGDYMLIENPSGDCGIGDDTDNDKKITINPSLNYEVSFRVKRVSGTPDSLNNISFGVDCFDESYNTLSLRSNKTGSLTNWFFQNERITTVYDTDFWVRGIIFNKDNPINSDDDINLNIGGNNLRFLSLAKYIIPRIIVNGGLGSASIYIYDIKLKPLSLPYSLGQLSAKNFIINYVDNNSEFSNENFETIVQNELVPYNSNYNPIYI